VQDAGSGSDSRTGIPVRRTPARAVDALRLGLRWLAHQPRDARTLYKMPKPAGGLTSGEQLGPTREKLESQAWTPAGPANALRLALWRRLTARRMWAHFDDGRGRDAAGAAAPSLLVARCART
jgi:hypothetical protein